MAIFWWRRRPDDDYRAEIESHLAFEADRQVVQGGLDPDSARNAARRAFGNTTRAAERFHESQRWAWAERIGQHARYAARALRKRPAFTVTAVITLAIGIGFNTAIFTLYYAIAVRALPVPDADRLVNVYQEFSGTVSRNVHGMTSMVSYPEFLSYQSAIDSSRPAGGPISNAAVYAPVTLALRESPGGSLDGQYVSCGYFTTVGARMAIGRAFVADECAHAGAPAVTVLSHSTWRRDFGGDSSVVGRVVHLNQVPFQVIGVAEPRFGGLGFLPAGGWVPVTMQPALDHGRDSILVRDWSWLMMAARLAPGATIDMARARLTLPARNRDALYPGRETHVVVAKGALMNFPEFRQRSALAMTLIVVLGALVVAMVCANLMSLLLARGVARRREISIRLAVGASRRRLIEQLFTESAVLALAGGVLGLAIAYALPALARRMIPVPVQFDLSPDGRVMLFTLFVSLVTAIAFGLVPALHATKVDLVSAAKGGASAGGRQIRPSRLRGFIVGVQVAGSTLLLVVAALFVRAASRAATVDPGYTTEGVVSFGLNLRALGYGADRTRFTYESLRDRIAATPGVQSVALASPMPLLGRRSDTVIRPDSAGPAPRSVADVGMANVTPEYFTTLQIPLVTGRVFTNAEISGTDSVNQPIVISRMLAQTLWPSESAVGKVLNVGGRPRIVVGVAADTRAVSLAEVTPFLYIPALAGPDTRLRIVVRGAASIASLERSVPDWARALDPGIVTDAERLSRRVTLALTPARVASGVAAAMGVLTMLLALVGIYGVVSFAVSQRTRDIAVRLALGDTQRGVVQLMMRQGSRPVIAGLAVGFLAAFGVSQVIRGFLLGMSPLDPVAYIAMAALLMLASLAAMYAPARYAAGVNPALTLRDE